MLEQIPEQEVCQRILHQASLYWSEVEFRRLLEKLPAGAYMCDPNGLITYFNQRAVELWGRAPKLNDPEDRFCGSFKLFSADGSPIRPEQCWMALGAVQQRGIQWARNHYRAPGRPPAHHFGPCQPDP